MQKGPGLQRAKQKEKVARRVNSLCGRDREWGTPSQVREGDK